MTKTYDAEWWSYSSKSEPILDRKPLSEAWLQTGIDITIKRGVDKKYDEELGLTGRSIHQIIIRLASALEERDEELAEFRLRTRQ